MFPRTPLKPPPRPPLRRAPLYTSRAAAGAAAAIRRAGASQGVNIAESFPISELQRSERATGIHPRPRTRAATSPGFSPPRADPHALFQSLTIRKQKSTGTDETPTPRKSQTKNTGKSKFHRTLTATAAFLSSAAGILFCCYVDGRSHHVEGGAFYCSPKSVAAQAKFVHVTSTVGYDADNNDAVEYVRGRDYYHREEPRFGWFRGTRESTKQSRKKSKSGVVASAHGVTAISPHITFGQDSTNDADPPSTESSTPSFVYRSHLAYHNAALLSAHFILEQKLLERHQRMKLLEKQRQEQAKTEERALKLRVERAERAMADEGKTTGSNVNYKGNEKDIMKGTDGTYTGISAIDDADDYSENSDGRTTHIPFLPGKTIEGKKMVAREPQELGLKLYHNSTYLEYPSQGFSSSFAFNDRKLARTEPEHRPPVYEHLKTALKRKISIQDASTNIHQPSKQRNHGLRTSNQCRLTLKQEAIRQRQRIERYVPYKMKPLNSRDFSSRFGPPEGVDLDLEPEPQSLEEIFAAEPSVFDKGRALVPIGRIGLRGGPMMKTHGSPSKGLETIETRMQVRGLLIQILQAKFRQMPFPGQMAIVGWLNYCFPGSCNGANGWAQPTDELDRRVARHGIEDLVAISNDDGDVEGEIYDEDEDDGSTSARKHSDVAVTRRDLITVHWGRIPLSVQRSCWTWMYECIDRGWDEQWCCRGRHFMLH